MKLLFCCSYSQMQAWWDSVSDVQKCE